MAPRTLSGCLISDFNAQNLGGYLKNDAGSPALEIAVAPYGQVAQVILDRSLPMWRTPHDFAVVWTTPEGVLPDFSRFLDRRDVALDTLLAQVDDFGGWLASLLDRARLVMVPLWVSPSSDRGMGLLDMRTGIGVSNTLLRLNLRLIEQCEKVANLHPLNTARWVALAGRNAFSPKLWYMAKVAFGNEVLKEAARDIRSALIGIGGGSRKVIVLDLDNTLWGGILGDVGWENLKLGGHDPIGEAFVDFQKSLKTLTRRGILLALASKNEEDIALEAIRNHPEMLLRENDFAAWRIHWGDKAASLQELAEELNLGLQSMIFIDDSPVERARVREALPEVLVPEWPEESLFFKSALLSLPELEATMITGEDAARTDMYVAERHRKEARAEVGSLEGWIETLGLRVHGAPLSSSNLQRSAQLLNKTNQMNLSTRRLTEAELASWATGKGRAFWTFQVADKFADYGLTGLVSLEMEGPRARIVDYVLSCRVMGRKIEETLLHAAIAQAVAGGASEVVARYVPTAKNKPCLAYFRTSGMEYDESAVTFRWPADQPYPLPRAVQLTLDGE